MPVRVLAIAGFALLVLTAGAWSEEAALPPDFVRLADVAPTIRQDLRYAGAFNFTGKPVPGYLAAQCILWRPAAEALARAQARLATQGVQLKTYDCYRPVRAVLAFAAWSQAPGGETHKHVVGPGSHTAMWLCLIQI